MIFGSNFSMVLCFPSVHPYQTFAFYGGVPLQVVYDNLKAVVDTVLSGKEKKFNHRFMVLANNYLFESVSCAPAAGWEKWQVENQVGNIRD